MNPEKKKKEYLIKQETAPEGRMFGQILWETHLSN